MHTEIFVILDHFLPFYPTNKPKNHNFEKMKKKQQQQQKNRRYYHFTFAYHELQSYDVWFLRYGMWQTEFFLTLDHFLPFYSPKGPKNYNFDKMKKTTRHIIILYKCSINENHMMCVYWDMKHTDLLSFWAIFCPFTPPATPKNQNFEKIK